MSAGSSLVKQATISSIITDLTQIQTAIVNFKGVYKYLPADFPNANAYWPGQANGNGDGWVDGPFLGTEFDAFWGELSAAGMITLNGTDPWTGAPSYVGKKVGSIYRPLSWWFHSNGNPDNTLAYEVAADQAGIISPIDLSNIDIKIDDGLPAYGVVRGGEGSNFWGIPGPCVDDPDNTTKYSLQNEGPNCYMYYYYSFR